MFGAESLPKVPNVGATSSNQSFQLAAASAARANQAVTRMNTNPAFLDSMEAAGKAFGESAAKHLANVAEALKRSKGGEPFRHGPTMPTFPVDRFLMPSTHTKIPAIDDLKHASDILRKSSEWAVNFGKAAKGLDGVAGVLGNIARTAGPAGVALGMSGQAVSRLVAMTDWIRQEQRRFAYASPSIAANVAQSDVRQLLRDLRSGESIAGSNRALNESLDRLSDQLQPVESAISNVVNGSLSAVVDHLSKLIDWLADSVPAFKAFLKQDPKQNTPWIQNFGLLALAGAQNKQLANGLKPRVAQEGKP